MNIWRTFKKGMSAIFSREKYRQHSGAVAFVTLISSVLVMVFLMNEFDRFSYKKALLEYNEGEYGAALERFRQLGDYKDSQHYFELANKCLVYLSGCEELEKENYYEAWHIFLRLDDFAIDDDSLSSRDLALESEYAYAVQLYEDGNKEEALTCFNELNEYKDSKLYVSKIISESETDYQNSVKYANAYIAYQSHQFNEALAIFRELDGYKDSIDMIKKCEEGIQRERYASTISAGIRYSLALKDDHTILFTGDDSQKFDFSNWENIVSISGFGTVAVGLKYDGTVCITPESRCDDVSDWTGIVAISTGQDYVVGLKDDGTVVGAGHNGDGQIDVMTWNDVVAIATAWRRTVGLTSDGTIYMTGYGSDSQLREIKDAKKNGDNAWTNIVAVATGGGYYSAGHTVGLRADGHVVAVGDNSYGQCQIDSWENIVAIAAGDKHTVGLTADGKVLIAGSISPQEIDADGTVIGWDNIVAIAAGTGYTLGLCDNGTVVALGFNRQNQIPKPQEWTDIIIYDIWEESKFTSTNVDHQIY